MRIRIIIDTQDADQVPDLPFTLSAYSDDDDGTESRGGLDIGPELSIIGYDIPAMFAELAECWRDATVLDQEGEPMPRTGAEWLQQVRREAAL